MRWRTFLEPVANDVNSYVAVYADETWAELKVADCNHVIVLSFYLTTARRRKAAQVKLARLQRALDLVAEAIEGVS
jgi:hypothetical protein